ncbi:hypothetical protein ANN_09138 [Periplaneta americana]|uniref:Uncharacterized protein n=1 Tax=Periplaneta americana TaxID=6978 RepID=A0ABQ8TN23_PERAM|nr:hypothetical protein ANN_09138 [Periplaneta americana]
MPGRSFQDQKCRHPGCSEVETLGHVLGYCPRGELLRNNRHHKVRSSIATTLRKAKWEVYEEVHCLAENGSTRRADIIAIDRRNQRSLILDPTVRFEKDDQQANNVNNEKKSVYNSCIPHFREFMSLTLELTKAYPEGKVPINAQNIEDLKKLMKYVSDENAEAFYEEIFSYSTTQVLVHHE